MRTRRLLFCGGVWLALASGFCAGQQKTTSPELQKTTSSELPEELRLRRDVSPMPTLEVVTTRKTDGKPVEGLLVTTMKWYIQQAYGISPLQVSWRLVGAPSWLESQSWVINGKPSDEQRDAMKKMTPEEQMVMGQMQRRSVLEDLFKLKAHIETRQLPYFELVPAKGGLKIKELPELPPPPPGGAAPSSHSTVRMVDGKRLLTARAVTMRAVVGLAMGSPELDGRLVVDKTGFKGHFDLVDMPMPLSVSPISVNEAPQQTSPSDMDAPSIFTTLQEMFGVKLVPVKGPVEVLVIDSIEEPREN